ncbi:MAG: GtrA family protein [Patescibacteria group bacterium]
MIQLLKKIHTDLDARSPKLARIIRYLIAGGTSTFTDLALLYIFTEFFHIWYLTSAILAFILAFFVSFFLQKYWTFQDASNDGVHGQMALYLFIALCNLGLNTFLMYLLVHFLGFHYMVAQFVVAGLIAIMSFFIYKKFVFKNNAHLS